MIIVTVTIRIQALDMKTTIIIEKQTLNFFSSFVRWTFQRRWVGVTQFFVQIIGKPHKKTLFLSTPAAFFAYIPPFFFFIFQTRRSRSVEKPGIGTKWLITENCWTRFICFVTVSINITTKFEPNLKHIHHCYSVGLQPNTNTKKK